MNTLNDGMRQKVSTSANPMIVILVFVVLVSIVLISIRRQRKERLAEQIPMTLEVKLSLNRNECSDFSKLDITCNYDSLHPVHSNYSVYQEIIDCQRYIALEQYRKAEEKLRNLYVFFPDDPEIVELLAFVLRKTGREKESTYFSDKLSFLVYQEQLANKK